MSSDCMHNDSRLLVRAREQRDDWGTMQVLECRDCGGRWSE